MPIPHPSKTATVFTESSTNPKKSVFEIGRSLLKTNIDDMVNHFRTSRVREFEKRERNFFFVTTGALVLSITFLADNATTFQFINLRSLLFSWLFLIVALLLFLVAYFTVNSHFKKLEDRARDSNGTVISEDTGWGKTTNILTFLSNIATVLGIILFAFFGYQNVSDFSRKAELSTEERQFKACEQKCLLKHGTEDKSYSICRAECREKYALPLPDLPRLP